MPLVEDLPDLFAGYSPSQGYEQLPPVDPASVSGGLIAAGLQSTRRAYALTDFQSFASIQQGMMAKQALRLGVPKWIEKPFQDAFKAIPKVGGENLIKFSVEAGAEIAKVALTGVGEAVAVALGDAVGVVPYVGAIVKIGIQFGIAIRSAVVGARARPEPPPPEFVALTYDYAEDESQGKILFNIAASGDWTDAFMPPSADPDFTAIRVASQWGPDNGRRPHSPSVRWHSKSQEGHGLVPGLMDQVATYQALDLGSMLTTSTNGARQPSGRKFATVLWQQAMSPSVQMFNIDSVKIQQAWESYYLALWKFADRNFDDADLNLGLDDYSTRWLRARIRQSASYSMLYDCSIQEEPHDRACSSFDNPLSLGGGGPVFKPKSSIAAFPREKLAKGGKLSGLYSDITRYVCQIHRERARAALGTIVCAYVSPDAPLLKADAAALKMHFEMRQLLLENPAVMDVELALIPDAEYRADAQRAQFRRPDLGLKAGGRGAKRPKPGIAPAVMATLVLPKPPDAPEPGIPEGAGGPMGAVDGGAGWAMAAAGAVALVGGALVVRKLWR